MNDEKNTKIFDDFPTVDCNKCERYYLNQCDGVAKGVQKPCRTFLATRSESIPAEIKSLRKALRGLEWSVVLIAVWCLIHALLEMIG